MKPPNEVSAASLAPLSFSAGATTLPAAVLDRVAQDVADWRGSGPSVLELPFSGAGFRSIQDEAEARLRRLLAIPDSYAVLFAQGGATAHFALAAMNLAGADGQAAFVESGLWSLRAMAEAARVCPVSVVVSGALDAFLKLPELAGWDVPAGTSYLHVTTNESADGLQFADIPATAAPLVADMTGDFLARPVEVGRFALIYASATKSLGAAGLTIVIVRRDLLEAPRSAIPAPFDYRRLAEAQSRVNTPPTFAIYLAGEMLRWMEQEGGLASLAERRRQRARRLYALLDASDALVCPVDPRDRSTTTLRFQTRTAGREAEFLAAAEQAGLSGLAGHPAIGGLRIALHAAHRDADIDRLAAVLAAFG